MANAMKIMGIWRADIFVGFEWRFVSSDLGYREVVWAQSFQEKKHIEGFGFREHLQDPFVFKGHIWKSVW